MAAFRAEVVSDFDSTIEGEVWAFQFSTGLIEGKAKEYVFVYAEELGGGRYKLSQLDWDIKRVVMVGGNLMLRSGRGTITAGYWKAMTEGDGGHMQDYDWFNPESSEWTEYSDSYADVDDASIFDINGGWEFVQDYSGVNARALFGYKMDVWKWEARGGYGLYSNLNYQPYDFGDQTVCKYKQEISMPYLGGSADRGCGKFMLSVYCIYSPFVNIDSSDVHILRDLKVNDEFEDGEMLSVGTAANYSFDSGWFITAAIDFQKIDTIVGDADYNQYDKNGHLMYSEKYDDYAGASNEYLALSLGVGKTF